MAFFGEYPARGACDFLGCTCHMFFLQRTPQPSSSLVPDNDSKCTCSHYYNFHRKEENRDQPSSSSLNFDSSTFQQPLSWLNSSQSTLQLPIPSPPARLLRGSITVAQSLPRSLVSSSVSSSVASS